MAGRAEACSGLEEATGTMELNPNGSVHSGHMPSWLFISFRTQTNPPRDPMRHFTLWCRSMLSFTLSWSPAVVSIGVAPEPWPPLSGGSFSNPAAPYSPDPLVRYSWPLPDVDDTILQYFELPAVSVGGSPAASFANASSAIGSVACDIHVLGAGTLTVDFGVEFAGWVEFDSPDLAAVSGIVVGIGEYSAIDWVGGFNRDTPKVYGSTCGTSTCTYRLETSPVGPELYEGVRFAFVFVNSPSKFTITALRGVAQAKPVNYVGAFASAGDPLLETVWYTAAYTVRATLQGDYMGSILMSRGDRFSWTGDAHPTQAASLATFANFPFVFNNLNRTKADCQGIATYCLYFVLSVADYFDASGDIHGIAYLTPFVTRHLDDAANAWANPEGLRFVGWDDRTGSGFANNTTPETQNLFRLLAIRSWTAASKFLNATGSPSAALKYAALAAKRTADIRALGGTPWWGSFGLHAGADAINAGFLTAEEAAGVAAGSGIGDIVKVPSQSNFNQYFILQALGSLGQLDRAVESIRVVWGSVIAAGATTFWETSHPSVAEIMPPGPAPPAAEQSGWVSYCHPWAAGPTPWLSKWVLGIRPLTPGYNRVLIAPHIAHSMHGVAGTVGTPHGLIALNASRGVNGRAAAGLKVSLPGGIESAVLRLSSITLERLGVYLPLFGLDDLAALEVRSGDGALVAHRVVSAPDAPLLNESEPLRGRSPSIEIELESDCSHVLTVTAPRAQDIAPWFALGSPFPPPTWPGSLVGSDTKTQGSWQGVYGAEGYTFFAFDTPATSGTDPFCGTQDEGSALSLECIDAGATITSILFASYGTPSGACPKPVEGACNSPSSLTIVQAACVGKNSCKIDVSNGVFGGDPCAGTSKTLSVMAHCSSGGGAQPGANTPPRDRTLLPSYVSSVRVVDYDGFCGSRATWTNGTDDVRALDDPAGGPRHLGLTQPCGCPTSPVDIALTDEAITAGKRYRLSLYFVDFAPAPRCGTLDGTNRSQEVYLLTGYPDLSPAAPRQYLADFSRGVWLSYNVEGNIRVRISTIRGDYAALSAVAFDPVA